MRVLGAGVSVFGSMMAAIAMAAHFVLGLYTLYQLFGVSLFSVLLFPITVWGYPFVAWVVDGQTRYLPIWGGLWAAIIVGAVLAARGGRLRGE